jgi:toxin-antitoxin system PIN domain toxin
VILCDSNVWLALALSGHGHHERVREWLETVEAPASVVMCRSTQQSLLRLLTNASVLGLYGNPPLTNRAAWEVCEAFLADERIVLREHEPAGLEPLWKSLALRGTASPKLWMDAYLAAFALAGRYQMVTTDVAFRQFPGLNLLVLGQPTA